MNESGIDVEVGVVSAGHPMENGCLWRLRLTIDDLEALKTQGGVRTECRGRRHRYALRFRREGKQAVRYIRGADEAAQVRDELAKLQARHRATRQLSRVTEAARRALRESKASLAPYLVPHGYVFHGLAIRKVRRRQGDSVPDHAG